MYIFKIKKLMNEIFNLDELKENIDENVELIKLTPENEDCYLIGYAERAASNLAPIYDTGVIDILGEMPKENEAYYFMK